MIGQTVFLDRDGTLNVDFGYVFTPERLELIPGAAGAVAALKRHGFRVVIVTNQSAIGRGMATAAQVEATNDALLSMLRREDSAAVIDQTLYCPHGPDESCGCRKPAAGLLEQLSFTFDPSASWVVGDKVSDLEFGESAGIAQARRILVHTGQGAAELEKIRAAGAESVRSAADIGEAVRLILEESRS